MLCFLLLAITITIRNKTFEKGMNINKINKTFSVNGHKNKNFWTIWNLTFQSRKQVYNCKCLSVSPSVKETPQHLRIKSICYYALLLISQMILHIAYQPSYLSAITPISPDTPQSLRIITISHHALSCAYQPSDLNLWLLKAFWLVYFYVIPTYKDSYLPNLHQNKL